MLGLLYCNGVYKLEQYKVSVIMPIYNGAEYISKGIESILNQTYKNIELIVVDDGSVDDSKAIVESFNNSKIKYIYKENAGVGEARNTGLINAQGDFVCFLDQDDWYDEDAIEYLLQKIVDDNADEVIGSFRLVGIDGTIKSQWTLDTELSWTKYRIVAPWGRIYRKSLIDKYNIRFLDTKISEDLYFNILFLSYTDKISILNEICYNWLYNEKSESHTNWNKISEERNPLYVLDRLYEKIKGSEYLFNEREYPNVVYFFTKYLVWYILFNRKGNDRQAYREMCKKCFAWMELYFPEYTKSIYTGLNKPNGEMFINRLSVWGCIILHKLMFI